jgi:repressor LexA
MKSLKEMRLEKGYTQMEVAKRVGVSLVSYQLWERGISTPNEQNQAKLDELFKD